MFRINEVLLYFMYTTTHRHQVLENIIKPGVAKSERNF